MEKRQVLIIVALSSALLTGCNKVNFSNLNSGLDSPVGLQPCFENCEEIVGAPPEVVPEPEAPVEEPVPEAPVVVEPTPSPALPIISIESGKPFYTVVTASNKEPWQTGSGGCVSSGFPEETHTVYPVCESEPYLRENSNYYSALYFDISEVGLNELSSNVLSSWVNSANQVYRNMKFQVAGFIASNHVSSGLHSKMMGQRLESILKQIAQQTTHKKVVNVAVAVRGQTLFSCQVDLNQNLVGAQACLQQARSYPAAFSTSGFFIDEVLVQW